MPRKSSVDFSSDLGFIYDKGAHRESNEIYSKIGCIKKITYPTGGSTLFEFESHEYGNAEGFKDIFDQERIYSSLNSFLSAPATGEKVEKTFSIDYKQIVSIETKISGYGTYARLEKVSGSRSLIIYGHQANANPEIVTYKSRVELESGDYKLVCFNYESDFTASISVAYKSVSLSETITKTRKGGGIRIKSIADFDEKGNLAERKSYEYQLPEENDRSSGVLVSQFDHDYYKIESRCVMCELTPDPFDISTELFAKYLVRLSTSAVPLSYSQGSPIEYSDVTVLYEGQGEGHNNGKAHTKFITSKEYPDRIFKKYPFIPAISHAYKRGLVTEQNFYALNEQKYQLVKKIENKYSSVYNPQRKSYVLSIAYGKFHCTFSSFSEYVDNKAGYGSEFIFPRETNEILYDKSGASLLRKSTSYKYDNPTHLQPTKIETTTSDGELITTKMYYPDDITSSTFLSGGNLSAKEYVSISKLKHGEQHRIATPIQVETWKNGKKISTQRTTFQELDNGTVLPEIVKAAKGTSPLEPRLRYHSYDRHGNPTAVSKEGGTVTSYIWGYNGQYPIAKIENASLGEVASALGTTVPGLEGYTEQNLSAINALRGKLLKAMVTTYTYAPLVGMLTQTDPNGITTFYEYDDFNRLKSLKDKDGNVLETYEYHYAGQEQ